MTKLAVVGATGLVGTKILETLDRKGIAFDELVLFSSARSAGQGVTFQGQTYIVQELTDEATDGDFDYVLMSAVAVRVLILPHCLNHTVPSLLIIQVNGA